MRDKQMKIVEFTKPEIIYLLQNCNFTSEEEELFLIRSSKQNYTLQAAALTMNLSLRKVSSINKTVKKKIRKVLK